MSISELLTWAERHSYPFLVLAEDDVLRHGSDAWRALIEQNDSERIGRVIARIEYWNAKLAREETTR